MRAAHDRAAEVALLGAALLSRPARDRARRIVTGGDFFQPKHEQVWDAMLDLDRQGIDVDPVVLLNALAGKGCEQVMVDVVTARNVVTGNVEQYADIVHGWAVRRHAAGLAHQVLSEAESPIGGRADWLETVVRRFDRLRKANDTDDVTGELAFEFVDRDEPEPEWVLPGIMERRERFMLTGEEGLGKSHLLRQFATHAAGGVSPWDYADQFDPVRVAIIDCENDRRRVYPALRAQIEYVRKWGQDPARNLYVECRGPMDLTRDRDLSAVHRIIDAMQPDLLLIGPLYKLAPMAMQTDDEAAPVIAALETFRERGCALIMEAHAGHADSRGNRDMRPIGSSAFLRWPDFGYGIRWNRDVPNQAMLRSWRGDRAMERYWPKTLHRSDGFRWAP